MSLAALYPPRRLQSYIGYLGWDISRIVARILSGPFLVGTRSEARSLTESMAIYICEQSESGGSGCLNWRVSSDCQLASIFISYLVVRTNGLESQEHNNWCLDWQFKRGEEDGMDG